MHPFCVDSPLNRLPIPVPSRTLSYLPLPCLIAPLSSASSTAATPSTPTPSTQPPSYTTPTLPMQYPTSPPTVQRVSRHSGNLSPLCREVLRRTAVRSQPPRHPAKRYLRGRELLVIVTREIRPTVRLPPLAEEDGDSTEEEEDGDSTDEEEDGDSTEEDGVIADAES